MSETTRDNAQVSNIDTAIRADQKAFFRETGKSPEHQVVSGTDVTADAMMSPMAGVYLVSIYRLILADDLRCPQTCYSYG